jgi:hypothetical protein
MNKKQLIVAWVMAITLIISGCASMGLERMPDTYYLNQLKEVKKTKEIIIQKSYADAFNAVINVFRDLNINILKKDYEGKVVFGAYYTESCYTVYGVFFEEEGKDKTNIIVKSNGAWFSDDFVFNKIKEEIKLQEKLNE